MIFVEDISKCWVCGSDLEENVCPNEDCDANEGLLK